LDGKPLRFNNKAMKKSVLVLLIILFAVTVSGSRAYSGDDGPMKDNSTAVRSESPEALAMQDAIQSDIDIAKSLAGDETIGTYDVMSYKSGNEAYQELTSLWMQVRDALGDSDTAKRNVLLDELQGRCLDFGITSFEDLSASIIKEGQIQLDIGNNEAAIKLFDTAAKISPNYPPAYYAKGWGIFHHNKLKFLVSLDSMIEGASKGQKNFWWSFYFMGNKVSSLLFTFAALFSLFGLFMAIRYSPLIAHDLSEKFNKEDKEHLIRYLFIPGFFLSILLLLGYWWAVTVMFLLLWVYFNKREKILSVIFFVMVVFIPTFMSY
jgi:tetratricopeptide (TPR) repeat protein